MNPKQTAAAIVQFVPDTPHLFLFHQPRGSVANCAHGTLLDTDHAW
jgi:hypothetical protein